MVYERYSTMASALVLSLVLAGCAEREAARPSFAQDSLAIAEASRAFSAALVAGDTAALGALYTEDAVLMPPNRNVHGNEAVRSYFAPSGSHTQVAHELVAERLLIEGDLAVDMGTWSSTTQREGEDPRTSSERYLVVWRRQTDGSWKIAWDAWHWPRATE